MKGKPDSFFSIKFILRLFYTLHCLKWQQFFFRAYYPFKSLFFTPRRISQECLHHSLGHTCIQFPSFSIDQNLYNPNSKSFVFLNREKSFPEIIDWEYEDFGLLWTFHLHYFDWLNDSKIDIDYRLDHLLQYTYSVKNGYVHRHSYPASLRIINCIKFLVQNNIKNEAISKSLFSQTSRLCAFPEYEIMANHLLMNGMALVWAGIYFGYPTFENLGKKIVRQELEVQVLADGIHFEKSPAYQSLIIKDLLCLLSFIKDNDADNQFYELLQNKSQQLLSGLSCFVNPDGSYMNFGDSNQEMSILFRELLTVAQNLHIKVYRFKPSTSGFRDFDSGFFHLLLNLGNIAAHFQPGHSHADAFSFCLNVNEKQIIVDRAVSTYEQSLLRLEEKGTAAHNTICIEDANSADIWSSFRMGKKVVVDIFEDTEKLIEVEHDGYVQNFGIIHRRLLDFRKDNIYICDQLKGWDRQQAYFYFHFHPDVVLEKSGDEWLINKNLISIQVDNCDTYTEDYQYCKGFNKTVTAKRIVGKIQSPNITTVIKFFNGETN
jgi:hypothetical protein